MANGIESWNPPFEFTDVQAKGHVQHLGVLALVTAGLSNLVSNVPAVMLLKSVVPRFANPHTGWLVLAMASTLSRAQQHYDLGYIPALQPNRPR